MTMSSEGKERLTRLVNEKWQDLGMAQIVLRRLLKPLPAIVSGIPEFTKKYTLRETKGQARLTKAMNKITELTGKKPEILDCRPCK